MTDIRVFYQDGGSKNFRWHETLRRFPNITAAKAFAEGIRAMGYPVAYREVGEDAPTHFVRAV